MTRSRLSTLAATVALVAASCATHHGFARDEIRCGQRSPFLLMAQAIPTAEAVPCLHQLPTGVTLEETTIRDGHVQLDFRSDRYGRSAATLTFEAICRLDAAVTIPASGGCLSWDFSPDLPRDVATELQAQVGLVSREQIQADVRDGFIKDAEL